MGTASEVMARLGEASAKEEEEVGTEAGVAGAKHGRTGGGG